MPLLDERIPEHRPSNYKVHRDQRYAEIALLEDERPGLGWVENALGAPVAHTPVARQGTALWSR